MTTHRAAFRISSVAFLLASAASPALAQDGAPNAAATESSEDEAIRTSNEIVVIGGIGVRNRTDSAEPTLVYDEQYFQRFEPLTAGDALKRVPSVTFLADVIESDGARLRGLDPGYTQILINGDKVPGGNADRSFFIDRIPAELIQRVEIVRSSSARRTGDAVAGTLNIVLRDGYQLDGGYIRAGGIRFDDGEIKPNVGGVIGGALGPGRFLIGGNVQGRYNPKLKTSLRFSDSPENNPNFETANFVNREDQRDTRDGTDYAFNASYDIQGETTDFELSGYYVRTDRLEDERSFEYNDRTTETGPVILPVSPLRPGLLSDNANVNDINQESYSVLAKISQKWALGETKLKVGYASFQNSSDETEYEIDFTRTVPRFTGDVIAERTNDEEISVNLEHAFELTDDIKFIVGGFLQNKDRDTNVAEDRNRFNLTAAARIYDQFARNPTEFATAPDALVPNPGGVNTVEEDRLDFFGEFEGKAGNLSFLAGLRYETTDYNINDLTVAAPLALQSGDYSILLPSASIKYDLQNGGRITASVARTNRRPRLDFLSPALLEAELGDNDLLGNSALRPETSWGGDLGYEQRLGRNGVIGVNVFYRDITDLVEVTSTGTVGSEGAGTLVLQPRNVGNGQVYGIEFDLSTDLGFLGLKNTGIFGNLSILDSKTNDFIGERRFNGQSNFVYNFGAIQDIPSVGVAFGATYRKQGEAFDRIQGEEIFTTYGPDLEVFVEKKFGKSFTIRAVGSNLLNATKDEAFNKFNTNTEQQLRQLDEYELESEEAGPFFQIVARLAF